MAVRAGQRFPCPEGSVTLHCFCPVQLRWIVTLCRLSRVRVGIGGVRYISNVTTDGGHTWSSSAMPGTFRGYALECNAQDFCIAGGEEPTSYRITDPTEGDPAAVFYSSSGGVTWSRVFGSSGET